MRPPAQSAESSYLSANSETSELDGIPDPERYLQKLSGLDIDELWGEAAGEAVGLLKPELARVLLNLGIKYNYGLAQEAAATRVQIGAFWRSLQLKDLALAHACALGRDAAWQQFITRFREPLTQAAISITGSLAGGHELAGSLYADLFGITERGEQRRSPLAYYSGRGSLKGFLRATLAQRHVDHLRRTTREAPMADDDLPAAPPFRGPGPELVRRLGECLAAVLRLLTPEERFLLSAWFLDRRTLLEISHLLRVHEATVSRRLQRLTARLHQDLLKNLELSGMSRAAAKEALGTDPRDLDINLRTLLQSSQPVTFLPQETSEERRQS